MVLNCSIISYSLHLPVLEPVRFLCPWNRPGKHTGVGWQLLLQGIVPIQGSNPHLLHLLYWQVDSLPLKIHFSLIHSSKTLSPNKVTLSDPGIQPMNWGWGIHWPITLSKIIHLSSVQSLSHIQLFATPWTAAYQASLSITNSRS